MTGAVLSRLRRRFVLVALAASASVVCAQSASPIIPGLGGSHPLAPPAAGAVLAGELRCAACHDALTELAPAPPGPDLSDVASRVRPDYLRRFLVDPHAVQPGTKMPDVLQALSGAERAEVAEALTHYLAAGMGRGSGTEGANPSAAQPVFPPASAKRGEALFHSVGCVACHQPRRAPAPGLDFGLGIPPEQPGSVPLGHATRKYAADALADFLFDPTRVRPAGRMPDMGLGRGEARDVAAYLEAAEEAEEAAGSAGAFTPDAALVERGRVEFERRGCSACHAIEGVAPVESRPIADAAAGCLADAPSSGVDFGLSPSQRTALRRALIEPPAEPTPDEAIAATLTALNCIACHVRDDYGGVPDALDPYFTGDDPDLGDDARIPPPLTLAGAKLDGDWMREVILEGAGVRSYMHARMPRFGGERLALLPELFERADAGRVPPFDIPVPRGEARGIALNAGRELLGIRGLGCISCHDFNGVPSSIHRGIDLVLTTRRLKPDWFARFLVAPDEYRPGVVMPTSWPDGIATHRKILDGDTDAQLRAIWSYLEEGRTARAPEGMRPKPSILTVGDGPRVYRGRSQVAGFRGIAVGFPGGLSYAFDAQNGALGALWHGEFVSVRWDGQGAGDFDPRARPTRLARDVAFTRLESSEDAWPLAPVKTEEEPVNPDPTYPRNHGYRFRGYAIGPDGVPTLRYASGGVEIVERSEPVANGVDGEDTKATLRRSFTLTAPAPETLWLRVLADDALESGAAPRTLTSAGLRIALPDLPLRLRPSADGRPADALLRLDLPAGETRFSIDYALLN